MKYIKLISIFLIAIMLAGPLVSSANELIKNPVEAWYTEDIIIIDETTDSNNYYYVNISHTAVESMTDGSIEYDTGKTDLTGITMLSNKGGVTFNVSGSEIIIDTGATTEAETYYYNFTLPSWTVSGNAYLNGDGVALAGATIKLNGIGTTITDNTGAWNFTNVPNGIYGLSATMTGYQGYHANLLVSGEDRTDIELYLSAFGLDEERPDFYTLIVIASILLFLMFYYERRAICYLVSFMALLTMLYVYSFSVFTFLAVMQMVLFVLITLIGAVKGTTSREM